MSRGLGDVYKRQFFKSLTTCLKAAFTPLSTTGSVSFSGILLFILINDAKRSASAVKLSSSTPVNLSDNSKGNPFFQDIF